MTEVEHPSYVVTLYGIDGLRHHFLPGNRRRRTGIKAKRGFAKEADALAYAAEHNLKGFTTYLCPTCDQWHLASPKRHGQRP
jgi:hypothetical protein